ncbi:MAG: heavy metal translocating P-type ATPase [Planctomycetota bacterium]
MTVTAERTSSSESHAATAVACDHCGLPVPTALVEPTAERQFCCGGCEVAYETIRGCGLDAYYAVRDRSADTNQAAKGAGQQYNAYDTDAFLERHAGVTQNGCRSIDLRLEGVHCAACVWLVERLPTIIDGVLDARLSLGSARLRLAWDPQKTGLSQIAQTLDRLGYAPHPARDKSAQSARNHAERTRLIRMAIAGALAGNSMLLAVSLYAGAFEGIDAAHATLFRWISMGIGWLSLAWPGATFFRSAWVACRNRAASLDQPIALALGVGAVAGTVNVIAGRGEIYFDSLSVLVFLLLVGRFLQSRQQRWAAEAVGLTLSMTPDGCRVVRDGRVVEESSEGLNVGDEVVVRPGELFPADGTVLRGASSVDQALLTGESRLVPVEQGGAVYAGSQNVAATLRVSATAVGESTRVGKLVQLVEDGLAEKPPIVRFADRIGGYFVVAVSVIACANFACWATIGGLGGAIESTVALLIVACPCALGLATPLTMAVAIGRGSRQGMLIKSAAVLEKLAGVDPARPATLLLDKTGTLTTGRVTVKRYIGDESLRPWVAAIEVESNHPMARAIGDAFSDGSPSESFPIRDRTESLGFGVAGTIPRGRLLVGSPRFAESHAASIAPGMRSAIEQGHSRGHSVVVVALDEHVVGVVWLSDTIRPGAKGHLDRLRTSGWTPAILSGDADPPVQRVAAALAVPRDAAWASVTPEGKLERVHAATSNDGSRPVMMVGDGVNDAAALAAADIGVAVHGGVEASLTAADVYFTSPGISKLNDLIRLARATMRTTRRNFAISLTYNAAAVTLAAMGWVTPLVAAVIMPLSSLSVLVSAAAFSQNRGAADPSPNPES